MSLLDTIRDAVGMSTKPALTPRNPAPAAAPSPLAPPQAVPGAPVMAADVADMMSACLAAGFPRLGNYLVNAWPGKVMADYMLGQAKDYKLVNQITSKLAGSNIDRLVLEDPEAAVICGRPDSEFRRANQDQLVAFSAETPTISQWAPGSGGDHAGGAPSWDKAIARANARLADNPAARDGNIDGRAAGGI